MDSTTNRRILVSIVLLGVVGALVAALALTLQPKQAAVNGNSAPIISFDLDAVLLPGRMKDILNNAVARAVENFRPDPVASSTNGGTDNMEPVTTSTGEVIEVGKGIRMLVPKGWSYQNAKPEAGEMAYIYDCKDRVEIGSIFCEKDIYVSSAADASHALLEYSTKRFDFAWFCNDQKYQECPSEAAKLNQVKQENGYWTVSSLGIAENAAIAFSYKGHYVVVFGFEEADQLYSKYRALLK